MKTFYDVLEVAENATSEEIELAYNNLKNKYEYLDENKIKKIEIAYGILSDEEKRKSYDKDLKTMRNDEIMSNLQKNTNTHNEELQKQEELKKIEEEKKAKEEELRIQAEKERMQEEKVKFVQAEIEKQIEAQKKQLEEEQRQRKKIAEIAYKEYMKNSKNNGKFTVMKLFRTLIATIIVVGVIFLIFQIPFVKNAILNNESIKSFMNTFNIK